MAKRLFIDLSKCDNCEKCAVSCSYFNKGAASDHGILELRELATFALICRRCEEAACVASCRFEAIERQPDGVMKRHNMRCVSCKSCSHACPFGTIYPETLSFHTTRCDFCSGTGQEPTCVIGCVNKAVEYREVAESQKDGIWFVGDHLAAKAPKWDKKGV